MRDGDEIIRPRSSGIDWFGICRCSVKVMMWEWMIMRVWIGSWELGAVLLVLLLSSKLVSLHQSVDFCFSSTVLFLLCFSLVNGRFVGDVSCIFGCGGDGGAC